jgi:hypothetical protein
VCITIASAALATSGTFKMDGLVLEKHSSGLYNNPDHTLIIKHYESR